MSNSTVYLKDYQPATFAASTVDLTFDIQEDHVLVTNTMVLNRQHQGPLCLFGDELELISIQLQGKDLPEDAYYFEEDNLIVPEIEQDEFVLTIVTRIRPHENTKLSGLYCSHDLFCTQCEAEGFRRMTYFLDRPDVLAVYTTKIIADKARYPVLLSNGNLIECGEFGDRHWVVWHDPFKKPAHLFALVAGKLVSIRDEFVTMTGRTIDLYIYVEPGNEDKCDHAMASLKRCMKWDEEVYGREYDLDIFMIVAVSDFNMGAMENKGLNIFNSKYILARPETATDQDYIDIEGVVGHEYFHNWTGNRVTCRDWFQLSLKEGLTVFRDQEFSRDMGSRDVNRILDVRALRNMQFPEDAGSMAHPVRPASYEEINNFYTATIYNKGAEVIRMQHTLLGKVGFRRGMDLYFERHDGQAVTIDDFVAAMEDANGVDFTQFKLWYSQAGTPKVMVKSHYENGRLSLTFTQSCPPTAECKDKKPFHIPIRMALFDAQGQLLPNSETVIALREPTQTFHFEELKARPIVSLLRDFSAPIILQREMRQEEWLDLLRVERDGFAKWDAAQQLALACMVECYGLPPEKWAISANVIDAYRQVLLDEALDPALRAELLTPPGYEELAGQFKEIDVSKVEAVRDFFRAALGKALFGEARAMYHLLYEQESHQMESNAYGLRKLKNVCLGLMMKADEAATIAACETQFYQAKTMTDEIASLALIVNSSQYQAREKALAAFYKQWQNNELVLDKWFSVQGSCELETTLHEVKALLEHPAFNIKNPNKVRSLLGAFFQNNPRRFHAEDGSGYEFLTDILLQLDKINPQIAARLATPFTRWQCLNLHRQSMIKQQLSRLASFTLSPDLGELVTKSLKV